MRKRRVVIPALAVVAVPGGVIWWAMATRPPADPDPVYAGHPISEWVNSRSLLWQHEFTVPSLDSNAVPYLVRALQEQDGGLRKVYNRGFDHVPEWMKKRLPVPTRAADTRSISCSLPFHLGVRARPAIPELTRVLMEDDDSLIRGEAAQALVQMADGADKPVVRALVAAATKDPDANVRYWSAIAVINLDPDSAAKAGVTNGAPGTSLTTNFGGRVR